MRRMATTVVSMSALVVYKFMYKKHYHQSPSPKPKTITEITKTIMCSCTGEPNNTDKNIHVSTPQCTAAVPAEGPAGRASWESESVGGRETMPITVVGQAKRSYGSLRFNKCELGPSRLFSLSLFLCNSAYYFFWAQGQAPSAATAGTPAPAAQPLRNLLLSHRTYHIQFHHE